MANQVDNLTLNDDTTGLNRTINVASDDLFLSVNLTLQSGGAIQADNFKRGTVDPNVGFIPGNEGDLFQRTLASTGQLWVNTDGTVTGWVLASSTTSSWSDVLAVGNTSGGTNAEITSGDSIVGQNQVAATGGDIPITAGSATGGVNDGGDVILNPGSGFGGGVAGIVQVNGPKHYANSTVDPTSPAPATGDRYYNTTLEMDMRYDGTRSKWLSVESATLQFGRNNDLTPVGAYLRAINGMFTSATEGYDALYNGTVVGITVRRSTASTATYAVVASGADIATVAFLVGTQGTRTTTADGDFSQANVLAARLIADSVTPESDVQMFVRIRWRV